MKKKSKGPETIRNVGLREQVKTLTMALSALTASKSISLAAAFEEWLEYNRENSLSIRTEERNRNDCMRFVNTIGNNESFQVNKVTAVHINAWINAPGPAKASTRRLWLAAVKAFFRWCVENQYCQVDPSRFSIVRVDMRKLDHEQKEKRYQAGFTDEEVFRLIAHMDKRIVQCAAKIQQFIDHGLDPLVMDTSHLKNLKFFRCAVPIARWAGLRISDVCRLEWACFSKPGKLVVWTAKRNRRVEVPLSKEVLEAISLIEIQDPKYCFPREKKYIEGPLRSYLTSYFGNQCRSAKMPCTSFHQLRHAFAKDCLSKHISMPHIASMLGHMSETTTEIYTTPHEKPETTTEGNTVQSMDHRGGRAPEGEGVNDPRPLLPGPVSEPQAAA